MTNKNTFKLTLTAAAFSAGMAFIPTVYAETNIQVYKNPACGCCINWVKHLQQNGFNADVTAADNRQPLQSYLGVPSDKGACHTAIVDDYFIEGHVPAEDIRRLLRERPDITGLAVPGMPVGSPGMENPNYPAADYDVLAIDKDGNSSVFSHHTASREETVE